MPPRRHSGGCRNPVKQRVAKGDTLIDWIPGQARYDDESKRRHSGGFPPVVIPADAPHRHSGECRNPVKQRVAKGDTLIDWIPGQARYDDESKRRHSGGFPPVVIPAGSPHRHSGECRNPVKQRVAKGDTLIDWIPGQARYDDESKRRHSGGFPPAVIPAGSPPSSFRRVPPRRHSGGFPPVVIPAGSPPSSFRRVPPRRHSGGFPPSSFRRMPESSETKSRQRRHVN